MSPKSPIGRHLTPYTSHLPAAERQRRIAACPVLTWEDAGAVVRSYRRDVPTVVRHLVAERLDLMSGPFHRVRLLRYLLQPGRDEARLWTTLMTRANARGRDRLVAAFGDNTTLPASESFGTIWTPETWACLPSVYRPGSPVIDGTSAGSLLKVLATGVHHADDTSAPGEIWTDVLVVLAERKLLWIAEESEYLAGQASWFLAAPHRLSDSAVQRLLTADDADLRQWTLTTIIPQRRRPLASGRRTVSR